MILHILSTESNGPIRIGIDHNLCNYNTWHDSQNDQDDQNTKAETFEKFAVLFELHRLCLEIVAHTPFGVYIFRLTGIGLDLFSQAADMYIYGTHISRIFITPDNVEQILSAVHLVRMKDQKLQHIKFFGSCLLYTSDAADEL